MVEVRLRAMARSTDRDQVRVEWIRVEGDLRTMKWQDFVSD